MKSYSDLMETALSLETRSKAVHNVLRTRHNKKKIKWFMEHEEETVELSKDWIINYENDKHHYVEIHDGISQKKRHIIVPTFKELVVQHCVVTALMPMFRHGMYEHTYASIPGRGAHKAKKFIKKWIVHDTKNVKYVLKMDIRHFFDSVPHDILKDMLKKYIHDKQFLEIVYKIIDVTKTGIPLGFYTSQWFSNWYLQGLDHYIKEELGAVYYVRYMDDMVIFGSNKRKLHKMRKDIERYLNDKLGLEMKGNWQVYRFDYIKNGRHYGRDLDFMGFRFYRDHIALRRSIMYKASRKALRMSKKDKMTLYEIRQILSYLGWIDATDTYNMYLRYIKPYVNFQYCKRRISSHDASKRKKEAEQLGIPYKRKKRRRRKRKRKLMKKGGS